jgi:hypothetical protein
MNFNWSKFVAVITGIFSLLLGILYLVLVQLLDMRGEMIPVRLIGLEPKVIVKESDFLN